MPGRRRQKYHVELAAGHNLQTRRRCLSALFSWPLRSQPPLLGHADLRRRRNARPGTPAQNAAWRRSSRAATSSASRCCWIGEGFSPGQIDGRPARTSRTRSPRCRPRTSCRPPVNPIATPGRRSAPTRRNRRSRATRHRRGRQRAVRQDPAEARRSIEAGCARLSVGDRADRRTVSHLAGAARAAESRRGDDGRASRSKCRA